VSAKITVLALCTGGCGAAKPAGGLVGVVDQAVLRSVAMRVGSKSNGLGDEVMPLGGHDAGAREFAHLQVLLAFSGGSRRTTPSISGASA
jgi:hypothetical protein